MNQKKVKIFNPPKFKLMLRQSFCLCSGTLGRCDKGETGMTYMVMGMEGIPELGKRIRKHLKRITRLYLRCDDYDHNQKLRTRGLSYELTQILALNNAFADCSTDTLTCLFLISIITGTVQEPITSLDGGVYYLIFASVRLATTPADAYTHICTGWSGYLRSGCVKQRKIGLDKTPHTFHKPKLDIRTISLIVMDIRLLHSPDERHLNVWN